MTERKDRKSETVMMVKIDSIIAGMAEQNTKLAVIEVKSTATEEHLRTLNGKVQAHESRLQTQEGIVALNAQILTALTAAGKETRNFWERNWEKFVWTLVIPGIIYFVLNNK